MGPTEGGAASPSVCLAGRLAPLGLGQALPVWAPCPFFCAVEDTGSASLWGGVKTDPRSRCSSQCAVGARYWRSVPQAWAWPLSLSALPTPHSTKTTAHAPDLCSSAPARALVELPVVPTPVAVAEFLSQGTCWAGRVWKVWHQPTLFQHRGQQPDSASLGVPTGNYVRTASSPWGGPGTLWACTSWFRLASLIVGHPAAASGRQHLGGRAALPWAGLHRLIPREPCCPTGSPAPLLCLAGGRESPEED